MNVHELTLQNYTAASGCPSACQPILYLGTAGSYGNEQINVVLGEGWQGLTVKAVFQPSGVPAVVPNGGGVISVPWEATQSVIAYPKGRISFQGYVSGRLVNTSDVLYIVGGSSAGTDNTPAPTPDEFQQFVDAVKSDADRAAQAAADAEAAVQKVTDAGTQAVTDIGNAKDSALEAIDKAREEATGSISADVEGAKQAAADAKQSAADAEQAAKDAADALANVQAAGQSALDDIATERQNTLADIQNEGAKQQSAVAGAGTAALEAIGQTEQAAINQVQQAGATQAAAVQSAGTTQISQINSAGAAQVQAVKDEGAAQTAALNDAAEAHKNELESIASHPPQPNTATGKWQVWNAETGAYQDTDALYQGGYYTPAVSDDGVITWQGSQPGMPAIPGANIKGPKGDKGDPGLGVPSPTQSDAGKVPTVKADGSAYELAGPYAPLSAAIRPTASGNPVSITDSVEWSLQGLRVYGKSTQETTTGAQLIDTQAWQAADSAYYKVAVDGGMIQLKPDDRPAENVPTFLELEAGDYTASINTGFMLQIKKDGNNLVSVNFTNNYKATFTLDSPAAIGMKVYEYPGTNNYPSSVAYPMINTGSTAKSWEPYTGGKPSPSPEYPQPIVSAGDEGSIGLTISDGADQSQQLTISTPNGLPGIPVNSGGNYTDAEGQQWVCDYKDYKNEVYIKILTLIPDLSIGTFTTHANGMFICDLANYSAPNANSKTLASMCTHFPTVVSQDSFGIVVSSNYIIIGTALAGTFDSVDDFNSLLREQSENNTPVQLLYYHNETTESPLSEEEIAAYRTLHTYDGATVVSTAEDVAGLEVKYVANAQKYIDNRLTAAESHIQEIAAAQLNAQTGG